MFLVGIFIASILLGCNNDSNKNNNNDETNDKGIIEEGTDQNPNIKAVDYDEYEFTFLTKSGISYNVRYIEPQGEEGNIFDDAVAKRNAVLEEKYNITIKQYAVPDLVTEVRTQSLGGDLNFDAILANSANLSTLARERLLYDLLSIERFDFSKSYWDQNAVKELVMGNKLYYTNCSLNTHSVGNAVFFNKKLVQDYNLTSPYEYINNNQWTLDNWSVMAKSISKDVNNDGVMTELDQYSQITTHGVQLMFLYGAGIRFTTNDETGFPKVSIVDNPDKLVNVYEKLKNIMSDTSISYCITCSNVDPHGYDHKWAYMRYLFTQDLYLFDYTTEGYMSILKDMESEFGIIPFPKYDSSQESYKTYYPTDFNMFAIPAHIKNIDRTANIIEDMNYYSSFILEPVWFDTLLARRYTRDNESEVTLRYIKENRVYDVGLYYNFGDFVTNVLSAQIDRQNISREYQRYKNAIDNSIKGVFNDFSKRD